MINIVVSGIIADTAVEGSPVKIKRQSVSFAVETKPSANGDSPDVTKGDGTEEKEIAENDTKSAIEETPASSSTYLNAPSVPDVKIKEAKPGNDSNGRYLMSGHARTHSIVINLDDKSRFTDEITV